MQIGDKLVGETGDVRGAAIQLQEYRLRVGESLSENIEEAKHLSPNLGEQIQELHRIGCGPIFRGETPKGGIEREAFLIIRISLGRSPLGYGTPCPLAECSYALRLL